MFSQGSSHPSQPTDRGLPGGLTTSHSREFERTLTPGASTGDVSIKINWSSARQYQIGLKDLEVAWVKITIKGSSLALT